MVLSVPIRTGIQRGRKRRGMTEAGTHSLNDADHHVHADPIAELSVTVGRNLRRLRVKQGYSLERLAKQSRVSRAMLGQIETGKSVPTIGLL